jgi:hypothetical protein
MSATHSSVRQDPRRWEGDVLAAEAQCQAAAAVIIDSSLRITFSLVCLLCWKLDVCWCWRTMGCGYQWRRGASTTRPRD